jgi:hypothetical protein
MMSLSVRQFYKEARVVCVYLADRSIKRLLKDVFICQISL